MQKLAGTTAMIAALIAIIVSLLQDCSILVGLKRAFLSYFVFYVVSAVLVMVFKAGIEQEWIKSDLRRKELEKRKREKEMEAML
jgi:hypothetical protein